MRYEPREYQERTVDFMVDRQRGYVAADPGLGKTSSTLAAFVRLQEELTVRRMLVVAPLRVARSTWPREVRKWDQFAHLGVQLLHGPKKEERAEQPADVYVINPEGLRWLAKKARAGWRWLPEAIVYDEATKFKRAGARRTAAAWNLGKRMPWRHALSGTPAPRGYPDLFSQVRLLDDGAALGRTLKEFQSRYLLPIRRQDYVEWELRPGADRAIEDRIRHLFLRLDSDDLVDLPELVEMEVPVELPPKARKLYDAMAEDMVAGLAQGEVTAANAGARGNKCRQIADGFVYLDDFPGAAPSRPDAVVRGRGYARVHDRKVEAVVDLVEEMAGQPVLVLYDEAHDAAELRRALGDPPDLTLTRDEDEQQALEARWNAGEVPVLMAQVATIAHGLNIQEGGCRMVFFSLPFDLEVYQQVLRRLVRPGQKALRVLVYHITAQVPADRAVSRALRDKADVQAAFLAAMKEPERWESL